MVDPIKWAGEAVISGTDANVQTLAGLREFISPDAKVVLSHALSTRDDGSTPARTCVLLCDITSRGDSSRLCTKLYADSPGGVAKMQRHARILLALKSTVPVPDVIGVACSSVRFGLPALITLATGFPLDHEMRTISLDAQQRIVEDLALAVYALHQVDANAPGIAPVYSPAEIVQESFTDADRYRRHACRAGEAAAIVAAVATGSFSSLEEGCSQMVRLRHRVQPSPGHHEVYDQGYAQYIELYERLATMFR